MKNILLFAAFSMVILFTSCKLKPGDGQPAVPATRTFQNPLWNTYYSNGTSTTTELVSFRYTVEVLTTDDNFNPIQYSGSPITQNIPREPSSARINPITVDLSQPQGATLILTNISILSRDCGWPIQGHAYSADSGGEAEYRSLGTVDKYPSNKFISWVDFEEYWAEECN
ncbi:MAG: hypothetical protein LAT76_08470 [Schleiferiaceae bacterium]|nr:hypothetical protein [Schleiferiaceae bacterium]